MFESSRLGPGIEVSDVSWRGHQGAICDVSLMVLHRIDLSGVKFDRFIAHGTVFAECDFDGAVLNGAEIIRWEGPMGIEQDPLEHFPSLSPDSTWDPSDFVLTDGDEETYGGLLAQQWSKAGEIWGCSMRAVEMSAANFTGLHIEETNLSGANLIQAELANAKLEGVSLTGVNLTGANLYCCNLVRVDLSGANLTGANLTGATMEDVNLDGVIGYER